MTQAEDPTREEVLCNLLDARKALDERIVNAFEAYLMELLSDPEENITCTKAKQHELIAGSRYMNGEQGLELTFLTPSGNVSFRLYISYDGEYYRGSISLTDTNNKEHEIDSSKRPEDISENVGTCYRLINVNRDELRFDRWIW